MERADEDFLHAILHQQDPVPVLQDAPIRHGQRWIYSAGFNSADPMKSPGRIDTELKDLQYLLRKGARIAVLAHQGSFGDGTAKSLQTIAEYLTIRLGKPVSYFPESVGPDAERRAERMHPGDVVLFGNTRFYFGEQQNSDELALAFSQLGDYAAISGFSKAHRTHASNYGIISHLPSYATSSLLEEVRWIQDWGRTDAESSLVTVLGGTKFEKVTPGLTSLAGSSVKLIPAGLVLSALLRARGTDVGATPLGDRKVERLKLAEAVLDRYAARIEMPDVLHVVKLPSGGMTAGLPVKRVPASEGVPRGYVIVDFELSAVAKESLVNLKSGDRAILAGTPSIASLGYNTAGSEIINAFSRSAASCLLLGGDTTIDLEWDGPKSTGGGSALEVLATGTCAVIEKLRSSQATAA